MPHDDPRYRAFLIANHVPGGEFHSRLYTALRHETGQTYGAFARYTPDVEPGPYRLCTFTRTENAPGAERTLRRALGTFHASGITAEELRAAAGFLAGRLAFDRQSPDRALSRWMWEARRGLEPGSVAERQARAGDLPLDVVNSFIRDFYDPSSFTLVTVRREGVD